MSKNSRVILVMFILVLTTVSWQSCTGALTTKDIVARAHWTMNAVESYHMLRYESVSSNGIESVDGSYTEVDFSVPIRYRIALEGWENAPNPIIAINDKLYFTTSSQRQYSEGYLTTISYAFFQGVKRELLFRFLEFENDFEEFPVEVIDGFECYHYLTVWDRDKTLAYMEYSLRKNSETERQEKMTEEEIRETMEQFASLYGDITAKYELWIDKNNYYIRKMDVGQTQEMRLSPDETIFFSTEFTIIFSRFNELIIIEPPLDDNGILLPGWVETEYPL